MRTRNMTKTENLPNELTMDELEIVSGGNIIGDAIRHFRAVLCVAVAHCTTIATTLEPPPK